VEAAAKVVSGPVIAVRLEGEKHSSSDASRTDWMTWEVLAFDAWLRGDPAAKAKLEAATSVTGGVVDHVTIRRG
jgi:hypothetical protein